MTEHKSFFRNVFDAVVESRTRQVEREMAQYNRVMGSDYNRVVGVKDDVSEL